MLLLGIRHRRQHKADCLAACSAMVLEYLGITLIFGEPLIEMPLIEYEIGWDEQDRSYAIIGLTKPETG